MLLPVWNEALARGYPIIMLEHYEIRRFGSLTASRSLRLVVAIFFGAICLAALRASAAVPPPEKLLPDDTLVMVTVPDFARARDIFQKSPQSALWNDPVMRPFREKFISRWKEEFVKPLERELEVKLDDYTRLPQG